MWCILDIDRFHELMVEEGDLYRAAAKYYNTDSPRFAMKCLGVDLTCSAREAQAVAGYIESMWLRGCSPHRITRFIQRYKQRISHEERLPHGWRIYGWMHRDTRIKWEPTDTILRAV